MNAVKIACFLIVLMLPLKAELSSLHDCRDIPLIAQRFLRFLDALV